MRYDPNSAESVGPWPDGAYEFTVQEACEKTSKAGNEMVEVSIRVSDADGGSRLVYDYLISSAKTLWKVKQFCATCGLDFSAGELDAALLPGKRGRCALVTEVSTGYPPKNRVSDYLPPMAEARSEDEVPADESEPPF